jgi:peptide/nickel transport system permease protein
MLAYLIRRIAQGLFIVVFVIWLSFSLPYLLPHGAETPAWQYCGEHLTATCRDQIIHAYGLNQNYFTRFWDYLFGVVVHFNLGNSFKLNPPSVSHQLAIYIPRTFWLAFAALLLAVIIALPMGVYQAWRRNSVFDYSATGIAFILYAMPAFVLGFILIDVFSFHTFHIAYEPPEGIHPWAIFTDPMAFLLPVLTLTALTVAGLSRFMRSQMLDVLVQDYIRTAKSKGCSPRRVLFRHAMRNALGPIVIIIGLSIPALLSGALITEEVFNYVGLGFITVQSALNQDVYTILGITVVVTAATVVGNLVADFALAFINPRIRIEGSAR